MARLFQTEKSRMGVLGQSLFKKDEAEFLRDSLTARKRSLLPRGNFTPFSAYLLETWCLNTHNKKCVSEYDEEDDNDDEEKDNEEDEKDEDY